MSTPTLADLLQRLRDEPEWTKASGIFIRGIISNDHAISVHNATHARLLAIVETLENPLRWKKSHEH